MDSGRLSEEPKLLRPSLVAAWPGVGQVALQGVGYLREKLGAVEFGEIDPMPYSELGGVFIEGNLIQPPRFPKNSFYYWRHPQQRGDLVFFVGEAQPSYHAYDFARQVLDVAERLRVEKVITLAAALVTEFTEQPRVWGAASSPQMADELRKYGVVLKGDFYVAGMNGILLAVAREKGLDTACLLGETPRFAPQVENSAASLAVVEVLAQFLGVEVDLTDLRQMAQKSRQEMERFIMESRREFIDRFTIPIWERPDEEEKA
jgi:proteasome assembly chaperone (PAC2) family protein